MESYKFLTKEAAEEVKKVAEDDDMDANATMNKVAAIENKILFKAFGKTKPQTKKKKADKTTLNADELLESQTLKVEEAISNVELKGKGRVGRIYMMKKIITGENKKDQEPVALRDPKDNHLIVDPEEIRRTTLEYCQDNLKKKEKDEKYKQEN